MTTPLNADDDVILHQRTERVRRLLTQPAVPAALAAEPSFEKVLPKRVPDVARPPAGAPGLPWPRTVLDRVEAVLQGMPAAEVPDSQAFRQALTCLLEHGEEALQRLVQAQRESTPLVLGGDLLASAEAIIEVDGTRPSFLLHGGAVPARHPFLGRWSREIGDPNFVAMLPRLAAAVGRLQPRNWLPGESFAGTGTLVSTTPALVLTNFHVVEAARDMLGIPMKPVEQRRLLIGAGLEIDFAGEDGAPPQGNRFRVMEALVPRGAGASFDGVDAAVLRLDVPAAAVARLPVPMPLSAQPQWVVPGPGATLCTLGFPDAPQRINPPGATVDWNFVVRTLFGNKFGVKRLAPGLVTAAPGSDARDTRRMVVSHDATVFDGASGSLLLAWRGPGMPAFALHFSGATLRANHALAFSRTAAQLRELGVPL